MGTIRDYYGTRYYDSNEKDRRNIYLSLIDPFHKSQNASDKYHTMHHFVTEMCTHVHISVTKCCIMGYGRDAFWDLWDGSI